MASEVLQDDAVIEVDPNKLVSKDGVLGFEKGSGFETVTNFDIQVAGYVGDGEGNVVGCIFKIILAVADPLMNRNNRSLGKQLLLTNKQMGNQATIINCLTAKMPALWIAQSKDIFLPQYVYSLCQMYMKTPTELIKRYKPVEIVGKQPESDTWVFNTHIQVDGEGTIIPENERQYVCMETCTLPYLQGIKEDLDDGAALKDLIVAEQELFQNNSPQVILAHAASAMAANYQTIVDSFEGCSIPFLHGEPVSGKTTALKAVMSVFGVKHFSSESSQRCVERKQSESTIPFGWDDVSSTKVLYQIVVNSFNACGSASLKSSYCPRTVPIITTNLEKFEDKINSRLIRIRFEKIEPRLVGRQKAIAELNLRKASKHAYRSVGILTAYIRTCILHIRDDPTYFDIVNEVEEACESLADVKPIEHRIRDMISLLVYCGHKMLERIGMSKLYDDLWCKVKDVILPSYRGSAPEVTPEKERNVRDNEALMREVLHEKLIPAILGEDIQEVAEYFSNSFNPTKCLCGASVVFNVRSVRQVLVNQLDESSAESVTENCIRAFIKNKKIGCVSVQTKFKANGKQCNAAHIQRSWFNHADLIALDEKFPKKVNQKRKKTVKDIKGDVDNDTGGGEGVNEKESQISTTLSDSAVDLHTTDAAPKITSFVDGDGESQIADPATTVTELLDRDVDTKDPDTEIIVEDMSKCGGKSRTTVGVRRKRAVNCLYDRLHKGLLDGKRRRK